MTVRRSLFVLGTFAFVACNAGEQPEPNTPAPEKTVAKPIASTTTSASTVATTPPEEPVACFPKGTANSPLVHVEIEGTNATVCVASKKDNAEDHPCAKVDTKTSKVSAAKRWVQGTPTDPVEQPAKYAVKSGAKGLEVCDGAGKDCHPIAYKPPKKSPHEGLVAAVNDDGSKLFVLTNEMKPGKEATLVVFGDTYEVKTGKRLFHVALTSSEKKPHVFFDTSDTWMVSFLGDRVLASGYRCCGPAGAKELIDPKTGDSLWLGDPQFFVSIDASTWLLGNESDKGGVISIVDVAKGVVAGKTELPNKAFPEPELYAMDARKLGDGNMLITFANPPGIAIVDVAKKSLSTPQKLPLCP